MPTSTAPRASRALRPRDAATLIIVRRDGAVPQVLMGKRHENHKFMPGKYVFPGGRVDFADSRVRPIADLKPRDASKLMKRMTGGPTAGRARAMAMAAVRETFEETGIPLGRATGARHVQSRSKPWQAFLDTGARPDLSALRFVARAITPPGRPRRYDTRFFLTTAEDWQDVSFRAAPSEELTDVLWVGLEEARELDLPRVTSFLLQRLGERIDASGALALGEEIPFFYLRGKTWMRDTL